MFILIINPGEESVPDYFKRRKSTHSDAREIPKEEVGERKWCLTLQSPIDIRWERSPVSVSVPVSLSHTLPYPFHPPSHLLSSLIIFRATDGDDEELET